MRRWARRAALAGAAASLAAALVAPGVRAQSDPGDDDVVLPDSFAGSASAAAIEAAIITPALVPIPNLFDIKVAEGVGTYESTNQQGRASLLFPGNGVVSGPDLLCGTFLGPALPPAALTFFGPILEACGAFEYPLSVIVDSLQPDASTEGALALGNASDPISVGAVGAHAHAGIDGTFTEAEAADLRILGVPALGSLDPLLALLGLELPDATILRVDGLTARTDQHIEGDRLVIDAEATVAGVRLLGGLVRIGSIVSHSRIEVGGSLEEPEVTTGVEVVGVSVAGVPAQLTEDGLVLGDPRTPLGPLLQQLTRSISPVLEGIGLRITTLPSEQGEDRGIPFAGSGGVVIEFIVPLEGLPPIAFPALGDLDLNGDYGVRIQIGTTGVRGFADTFDDPDPTTRPPTSSGGGGGGGGGGGTGSGSGSGTSPDRGVQGSPTPSGPSLTTPTAADPDTTPAGFLDDAFADRMAWLYLSFTLAALALCLAPRLTLPARFPGAGS